MAAAEVLTKFTADTSQVDKATKSLSNSFGSLTSAMVLGNVAAQAIGKTLNAIADNMDSAISRIDTLNNFPKVMKNLGISGTDAEEAIAILAEKTDKLPTSLEDAVSAVQRFTSTSGNVKDATETFLAVNNAILAGGANAQTQASALEQLAQAYSKGKPDAMEWRSLMTAMPAQLKQVADAMGYVNAADLGEAVRAKGGEKEFQRMIETIKRLNVKGGENFASFQDQALDATGGINTSIVVMKQAIVRGVADIIKKLNESLEPFGGISGVLTKIGIIGENVFKAVGSAIEFVMPFIIDLAKWIGENKELLVAIGIPIAAFVAGFTAVSTIVGIVTGLIGGVTTAFKILFVIMNANPIGVIIGLIAALVATLVFLWNNCEDFRQFWIGLWEGIKLTFDIVVAKIKLGIENIKNAFSKLKEWISNIWSGIKKVFSNMGTNMSDIGTNIAKGLWKGISNMKDWVINKVKDMGKSILKGLKKALGIASPSKQFAIVGKFSAMGYIEGLDGMQKEIDKSVNATFNPFSGGSFNGMTTPTPTSNITIQNSMNYDALGQLVNNVKTFGGGAKNDYNYVGGY